MGLSTFVWESTRSEFCLCARLGAGRPNMDLLGNNVSDTIVLRLGCHRVFVTEYEKRLVSMTLVDPFREGLRAD